MSRRIVVGLVGQPNVGKSTLFNTLTRGNAIVTNWPGTTVERNEGKVEYEDCEIVIVDLPGIYGLSYLTLEERISRKFIVEGGADLIVVLADSLILERTLYLVVEIRELIGKVIVAVTKVDEAHRRGIHVNYELLGKRLGVPVIPVSALKKTGIASLLEAVLSYAGAEAPVLRVDYGELEPFIASVESVALQHGCPSKYPLRWIAVKFLEGDPEVEALLRVALGSNYAELDEIRSEAMRRVGSDLAAFISTKRMNFIREQVVKNAIVKTGVLRREARAHVLFYNPYTAPLISVGLVFSLFLLAFAVNTGYPLTVILEYLGYMEIAETLREYTLSGLMERALDKIREAVFCTIGEGALRSFIADGLLGGLASVLVFVPLIALVMAVLGALEDSGLLPRLAIGTHMLFQRIGLSGHALLPVTLSLGCNVPGVMATRATPNYYERLKLVLLAPFIPCQARLIVLLALAIAIGGSAGSLLVPLIYIVAFTVFAVLSYAIYILFERRKHVEVELLMEVPPLHRPYLRVVWWFTWFHLKHFLEKAGTVIFLASTFSWVLQHFSPLLAYTDNVEESIVAEFSKRVAPLLAPLGITGESSWIAAYAVLLGFLAKELVVSATVVATGASTVREAFNALGFTPSSAIAFALFVALYVPCVATVVAVYSETRSLRETLISVALMLVSAYALALFAYSLASFLASLVM